MLDLHFDFSLQYRQCWGPCIRSSWCLTDRHGWNQLDCGEPPAEYLMYGILNKNPSWVKILYLLSSQGEVTVIFKCPRSVKRSLSFLYIRWTSCISTLCSLYLAPRIFRVTTLIARLISASLYFEWLRFAVLLVFDWLGLMMCRGNFR